MKLETGSINHPFSELVLIDAIVRAQNLHRAIYVTIEGEPGMIRVYPNGETTKIDRNVKVKKRRIVNTVGQLRYASSMVRKR